MEVNTREPLIKSEATNAALGIAPSSSAYYLCDNLRPTS